MSPMKPKDFLFKKSGFFLKGNVVRKNRKKGIIYLYNTQLRIKFNNGGERIIPLNAIKKLNLREFKGNLLILIRTDTNELCSFGTTSGYTKGLYRKLSEAIASLPDGGDVQVGPRSISGSRSKSGSDWCCIIFAILAVLFGAIGYWFVTVLAPALGG